MRLLRNHMVRDRTGVRIFRRWRDKWTTEEEKKADELRTELTTGVRGLELQEALPLEAYVGTYHDLGYHLFIVQEKGTKLHLCFRSFVSLHHDLRARCW